MTDDQGNARMDELLIEGARDYNEPRTVPRDEMWEAIAAARRSRSVPDASAHRPWRWPAAGIAAAALVALGIAIGRWTHDSKPVTVATTPTVVKPHADSTATASQPDTLLNAIHEETRRTDATARQLATTQEPTTGRRAPTAESRAPAAGIRQPSADSRQLAYRLVVLRHLAGSEALITTFRTTARRGEVDAQIGQWATELLGTTRLLESSPAADDVVMKRLLEDLDLVIAQIAQYAARGTYDPSELDLIEQSITQRGVITKLRGTTAPSPARM